MRVDRTDAQIYASAKRQLRFRWVLPLVGAPVWLAWLALISIKHVPSLDVPLPSTLLIIVVIFALRPVVDARVLGLLDRYVAADPQALEDVRGQPTKAVA
jgi:hypothetical protein